MNSILTCFHTVDVNAAVDAGPPYAWLLPLFFLKLKEQTSPTRLVRGVFLPGITSPLPEAHLHFKLSVGLRTPSPDCLWTLAIVPFSSLSDCWSSHHVSWFGYCILIEVQRHVWKLMELLSHVIFPKKEPPPPLTPNPIELSTHVDHLVPIRDWAINTSGWGPGVWRLLCLWFSLIYRTVFQGLQWESGLLLLRNQYSSVFDLIFKQTWASLRVKICCWTMKDPEILGLQGRRIQSGASDEAWSLRAFVQ